MSRKDLFPISILADSTGARFSSEVEELVREKKIGYMESVLELCEKYNLEPDSVARLLSKPIIEKLQIEGEECHLLPRSGGTLPI